MYTGIAVVGAGNLGLALANYDGFSGENFRVVALFDTAPDKVGSTTKAGIPIHPVDKLGEIVQRDGIDIIAVAVPAGAAQAVVDEIVAAGVRAVLNFAPARITGPAGVKIKNVDLTISLESLSYALARPYGAPTIDGPAESDVDVAEEHETV